MNGMEVLAPAGNLEIFKAVIDAGADAVYFGGKLFSARAYANNFDLEESKKALDYAHLHGKKAYLTLNTLVKNIEFNKELYDYIRFYYETGLDGIIVQDIGVIKYLRDEFPRLNVHGSTQLAVCSIDGINMMKELGVTRVVPARELSLDEIKYIHDNTDIELEVFVHGALCYCYSGDCLFSSIAGGRSGNRGRCAQPCRLEYDLFKGDKPVMTKGSYLLSLKDLCGVNDLDKLYNSGVKSLKIEGRMKQLQYAAGTVNVYRRCVDRLMETGRNDYTVDDADKKLLFDLGNRCGFTDAYYHDKTDDMVTFTKPSHLHKDLDISFAEDKLNVKCEFEAKPGNSIRLIVSYGEYNVEVTGGKCEIASKKPVSIEDIDKRIRKTGGTSFEIEDISYDIDDNIFIPLGEINKLRRDALDRLQDEMLSKHRRAVDVAELSKKASKDISSGKLPKISQLIISISNKEQFDAINEMDIPTEYDICIPVHNNKLFTGIDRDKCKAKRIFADLPFVIRGNKRHVLDDIIDVLSDFDGYVVHSYDGLSYVKSHNLSGVVIAGAHLYTFNNHSVNAVNDLGADYLIAPYELNNKELSHRLNDNSILTVYGRTPMMITANCINKNCIACDKTSKDLTIKDKKGHSFLVRNYCDMCYNVIYNDLPMSLLDEVDKISDMGFASVKIDFVDEDADAVSCIIANAVQVPLFQPGFAQRFHRGLGTATACDNSGTKYTRGHFNRGVE